MEYDSLNTSDFGLKYKVENQNVGIATYFRTVVKNYLVQWSKENGYDLFADGLKIYTTVNSTLQKYAEKSVENQMKKLQLTFDEHWEGENPWIDEKGFEIKNFISNSIKRSNQYKFYAKTRELYIYLLAIYLRYVALIFGAKCDIYLSGSIIKSISKDLKTKAFRKEFENSDKMKILLLSTSIFIINSSDIGLKGARNYNDIL